jgi:hypothetical protein
MTQISNLSPINRIKRQRQINIVISKTCCQSQTILLYDKNVTIWMLIILSSLCLPKLYVYCVRNVVAHGDTLEGKWRGNWRMEWVASTLTRPRKVVYPALLTLMRTPRLPTVDWPDSPADLNGLVRLGERRNVVSAHVPSGSAQAPASLWEGSQNFVWDHKFERF